MRFSLRSKVLFLLLALLSVSSQASADLLSGTMERTDSLTQRSYYIVGSSYLPLGYPSPYDNVDTDSTLAHLADPPLYYSDAYAASFNQFVLTASTNAAYSQTVPSATCQSVLAHTGLTQIFVPNSPCYSRAGTTAESNAEFTVNKPAGAQVGGLIQGQFHIVGGSYSGGVINGASIVCHQELGDSWITCRYNIGDDEWTVSALLGNTVIAEYVLPGSTINLHYYWVQDADDGDGVSMESYTDCVHLISYNEETGTNVFNAGLSCEVVATPVFPPIGH